MCLCIGVVSAAPVTGVIDWEKTLGGSDWDAIYGVEQTADGGYIVTGISGSTDFDVTGNHGALDMWVAKLNPSGTIIWQKSLGGSSGDTGRSVKQTADGGYIVAGSSGSIDGDVTGHHGSNDFWVVKLDGSGNIVWNDCYGGGLDEYANNVQQTADGGYIVTGYSTTTIDNGDVTGHHGGFYDYWVVKLDSAGNLVWQKCLGGTGVDEIYGGVQQTSDGNYIVAGWSNSIDGDVIGNHGGYDIWIVKLDPSGNIIGQKSLVGTLNDRISADGIQQTPDNGYIVTGYTTSNDGDVTGNHGNFDVWVVKLDSSLDIVWQRCLGGSGEDVGHSVDQTSDGGYIIAGRTGSTDGDVTGNHGGYDAWVAKLNADGTVLEMVRSLGGTDVDDASTVRQTSDGDYIIAASIKSSDGDVTVFHGIYDYWLVKLQIPTITVTVPNGGETWNQGTPHIISWTHKAIPPATNAKIVLLKGGSYYADINPSWLISAGTYTWTVPMAIPPGSDYTIAIESIPAAVTDTSDASFTIGSSPPAITNEQAVGDVVTNVYLGTVPAETALQVSNYYVEPGASVTLLDGTTVANPLGVSAWVVVMDDDKNGNLAKPFCYVFVNDIGVRSEPICTMSPSADASAFSYSLQGHIPNPGGLTSTIPPFVPDPACAPSSASYYAILISGGTNSDQNYGRYYNDIKFMYKTLVNDYGYPKANIKVLMSDGADPGLDQIDRFDGAVAHKISSDNDLDGGGAETIQRATKTNVTAALSAWKAIGTDKTLLIFTTGHGHVISTTSDPATYNVALDLWGTGAESSITDAEFASALSSASNNPKIIMIAEQCNGGGFKDNIILSSGSTRVLETAAKGNEVSHSNDFSYYWISGVAGHDTATPTPNKVDADTGSGTIDGKISMREAYTFANNRNPSGQCSVCAKVETPQIWEYAASSATSSFVTTCGVTRSITVTPMPVTTPANTWSKDSAYTIKWTTANLPAGTNLKIELRNGSTDGGYWQADISTSVGKDVGSNGVTWTVPPTLPGGLPQTPTAQYRTDYYIRIYTIGDLSPTVSGVSVPITIKNVTKSGDGSLYVTSTPSGTIILTDSAFKPVKIGGVEQTGFTTPKTFTPLAAAKYWVQVVKSCYFSSPNQQVQVNAGTTASPPSAINLVQWPSGTCNNKGPSGGIRITTSPKEGFEVFLKGGTIGSSFVDMGYETPAIQDIGVGDYTVKVEAPGFESGQQDVKVWEDEWASANFILTPRDSGWYTFTGFDNPVDMGGVINTGNAGKNIPLKWHLSDRNGYVSSSKNFDLKINRVPCNSGSSEDAIEIYEDSTATLKYEGNGAWHYNWKTDKSFATKCFNVNLDFPNGQTSPVAKFKFR